MDKFYNGATLLSLKDINGNTPEIFICTSNRSAGKTTYFSRLLVNRFLKKNQKFCLLYRFNYELDNIADKFFKDINTLFFNDYEMFSQKKARGIYHELYIKKKNEEKPLNCGYAIALNSADQIKKYSHFFSDTMSMLFDEFQSETNHYCDNEIVKFMSIHQSIARGQSKQSRYLPVYMLSNNVSLINPYYTALGISDRLTLKTKFLKGNGYVVEQGYNDSASKALQDSSFCKAFSSSNNSYMQYSTQLVYLNDSQAFIEKPKGKSRYLATLKCDGKEYAVREYQDEGIIYCDNSVDSTYPFKLAVSTADHSINYVMLKANELFIHNLRFFFDKGCFRFKNIECKSAILKAISY